MGVLIILALTVTMLHFRMQEHIQQEVRQMARNWLSHAGGKAGHIHYRLLSGDISIDNVQFARAGVRLNIARTYVHAPLPTLISEKLVLSRVWLSGLEIEIEDGFFHDLFQKHASQHVLTVLSALETVQNMHSHGAIVRIQGAGKPMLLTGGQFQLARENGLHRMHFHAFSADGSLDMSGNWQREDAGKLHMQTTWKWRRVPAGLVLTHLLAAHVRLQAISDGDVSWHGNWTNGRHEIAGRMALFDPSTPGLGKAKRPVSEIGFTGNIGNGRWIADLQCGRVPLAAVTAYAPVLNGRRLVSGFYSGDIRTMGGAETQDNSAGWVAKMQGKLTDVVYSAPGESDWHLGRVELSNAEISMPGRQLHIGRMAVTQGDIVFQPLLSSEQQGAPVWRIQSEEVSFQALRLGIQLEEDIGQLRFPVLSGRGNMDTRGRLTVTLLAQDDVQHWHIQAKADPEQKTLSAKISAQGVPLVTLRPLISRLHRAGPQGVPELAGQADLDIELSAVPTRLKVNGLVQARHVRIAQAGTQISVDHMRLDIKELGTKSRHIGRLRLDGWHYQTALLPMALSSPGASGDVPFRRAQNWRIDQLVLNRGLVSIGSSKAVWMRLPSINVRNLVAGKNASVTVQGQLGDGFFSLKGTVDAFAPLPRFNIHVRLRHALPFFLNDWFSISGAPRIMRGRLNADFSMRDATKGQYHGILYLNLVRGQLETGAFGDDPLLKLAGYSTHTIFERLRTTVRWRLKVPIAGNQRLAPLSLKTIGKQLLTAVRKRMKQAPVMGAPVSRVQSIRVAHVRLHNKKALTNNERLRLREVVRVLRDDPKLIVELLPELSGEPLDNPHTRRVRQMQTLIGKYLRRRGVSASRVFPVWPQERHRTGEVSGIRIQALRG